MFKRIKASFTSPREIAQYKNDRFRFVFLYLIILCLLASLPVLLTDLKSKRVSDNTRYTVREVLTENSKYMLQGEIKDGVLIINNNPQSFAMGSLLAVIMPTDSKDPLSYVESGVYYGAVLKDETVEIYFVGNKLKTYKYTDLGLENFQFNFISSSNYEIRSAGYEKLEYAYNYITTDLSGYWKTIDYLMSFFKLLLVTLVLDLFLAFLARGIKGLTFKQAMNIAIYSFAIEIIGSLLADLYGIELFAYIGSIIGIIYYFIAIRNTAVLKIDTK